MMVRIKVTKMIAPGRAWRSQINLKIRMADNIAIQSSLHALTDRTWLQHAVPNPQQGSSTWWHRRCPSGRNEHSKEKRSPNPCLHFWMNVQTQAGGKESQLALKSKVPSPTNAGLQKQREKPWTFKRHVIIICPCLKKQIKETNSFGPSRRPPKRLIQIKFL